MDFVNSTPPNEGHSEGSHESVESAEENGPGGAVGAPGFKGDGRPESARLCEC